MRLSGIFSVSKISAVHDVTLRAAASLAEVRISFPALGPNAFFLSYLMETGACRATKKSFQFLSDCGCLNRTKSNLEC